ncbi:MAG: DUF433 domain-containing protein [Candidatus Kapabacteria bacterium]|jgi:uncharacterized protein (DUF433 family)|nr:DUF433 domain-containing protein [Candidatus Kapabacteria bacterium]
MSFEAISIDPETMSGTPVFVGTRVPVAFLFEYLQTSTLEDFLENFPSVRREQALSVLAETNEFLHQELLHRMAREMEAHENFA